MRAKSCEHKDIDTLQGSKTTGVFLLVFTHSTPLLFQELGTSNNTACKSALEGEKA